MDSIAYVDRFARNWHRLATTDLSCIFIYHNRLFPIVNQKFEFHYLLLVYKIFCNKRYRRQEN